MAESTPLREQPVIAARSQSLYSKTAEYVFSNDKGGIERANLLLHFGENKAAVSLNGNRTMPIGAVGEKPGEALGGFTMQTDPGKGEAIFTRNDADGLEITKRFFVPQGEAKDGQLCRAYGVDVSERRQLSTWNGMGISFSRVGRPRFTPTTCRSIPKFDWMHEGKFQTIDVNWFNPSSVPLLGIPIRDARNLYLESKKDVTWTGVASQYFCTIVTTEKTKGISCVGDAL